LTLKELSVLDSDAGVISFLIPPSSFLEKEKTNHEKAKDHRAGGEGDSSRAHSIPDGTGNHQLHGTRTILKIKKPALAVFAAGAGYFTTLHVGLICM